MLYDDCKCNCKTLHAILTRIISLHIMYIRPCKGYNCKPCLAKPSLPQEGPGLNSGVVDTDSLPQEGPGLNSGVVDTDKQNNQRIVL